MFSFNFDISKEDKVDSDDESMPQGQKVRDLSSKNTEESFEWILAKLVTFDDTKFNDIVENSLELLLEERTIGKTCVKFLHYESVLEKISGETELSDALMASEDQQSDLIPSVYEGGLKVWECTWDLLDYIGNTCNIDFREKRVLELGCGAGLVGIYSLLNGATVTLQDYNEDVINHVTIPNAIFSLAQKSAASSSQKSDEDKNQSDDEEEEDEEREVELFHIDVDTIDKSYLKKMNFYSGDWKNLPALLNGEEKEISQKSENTEENYKYDMILTSETIYNPNNYEKLINTFISCLKPDGVVLVAAKKYYFGVGGGTELFYKKLDETDKLVHKIVFQHHEGVKREIIEIKFK